MKNALLVVVLTCFAMLGSISLKEAKQIGLDNNLSHLNSKNSLKKATAGKLKAYSAILPTATASGSYNKNQTANNITTKESRYSLNVQQPIFQSGAIIYGMKIASSQERIAENSLKKSRVALLATVEDKYFLVLEAKKQLDVAQESRERAGIQFANAQTRHMLGAISNSDFMQFQLEKSQSEVSLFSAQKQFKAALKDFNNYLNARGAEPKDIDTRQILLEAQKIGTLGIEAIDDINLKLAGKAKQQNIDLLNLAESRNTAKYYLRLSQTSFLPSVNLSASKNWSKPEDADDWDDTYSYGLNVSLPIFPLVDKGLEYQSKKYDYRNSQNTLKDTQSSISLQTETTWLDLITAAKNLSATKISLDYAGSLYEEASLEFELGKISSSDYLSSSISLGNAQSQYYSAIYEYLRKKSQLNKILCEEEYTALDKIIFEGAE